MQVIAAASEDEASQKWGDMLDDAITTMEQRLTTVEGTEPSTNNLTTYANDLIDLQSAVTNVENKLAEAGIEGVTADPVAAEDLDEIRSLVRNSLNPDFQEVDNEEEDEEETGALEGDNQLISEVEEDVQKDVVDLEDTSDASDAEADAEAVEAFVEALDEADAGV